jgi:antitoxin PrlF
MPAAKLSTKCQVTLPISMRTDLKLVPGGHVNFEKGADGRWFVQRKTRDVRDLKSIVQYDGPAKTLEEIDEGIAEAVAERLKNCA